MDLKEYIKNMADVVDQALDDLLPGKDIYPDIIHQAMRYSVFAGGKRLRPILCLAGVQALGKEIKPILPAACALEMIHTYSLIHDDLPAMDNDDYRRGKLTNHKVYGEGQAILAGDALLTHAFQVLADYGIRRGEMSPEQYRAFLQVIAEVAQAAGCLGMIGGQVVDLLSEGKAIDGGTLKYIHSHKTGALFKASVRAGAILSGAGPQELAALTLYAENFGLAFQITDDILDVTGDEKKLGKPTGSDEKNHKATYPALYGLEQSRKLAGEAIERAAASLQGLPGEIGPLVLLVRYLAARES